MPDFMRIKSRRRIFRSLVVVFDKPATDRRTRTSVVIIQQGPRAVRSCTDICRSAIIDQGQSPFLIDTASKTHGSPNGGGRSMSSRCRNIQGVIKPKSQAQAHPQSPAGNHVFSIEFTSRPLPRTIAKRIGSPTRAERASKQDCNLRISITSLGPLQHSPQTSANNNAIRRVKSLQRSQLYAHKPAETRPNGQSKQLALEKLSFQCKIRKAKFGSKTWQLKSLRSRSRRAE